MILMALWNHRGCPDACGPSFLHTFADSSSRLPIDDATSAARRFCRQGVSSATLATDQHLLSLSISVAHLSGAAALEHLLFCSKRASTTWSVFQLVLLQRHEHRATARKRLILEIPMAPQYVGVLQSQGVSSREAILALVLCHLLRGVRSDLAIGVSPE